MSTMDAPYIDALARARVVKEETGEHVNKMAQLTKETEVMKQLQEQNARLQQEENELKYWEATLVEVQAKLDRGWEDLEQAKLAKFAIKASGTNQ
jgi:multidrug resistance efflux pump